MARRSRSDRRGLGANTETYERTPAIILAGCSGLSPLATAPTNRYKVARKNVSNHEALARTLSDKIAQGKLKVGDLLPTELELQRRFALSRYGVREALRVLKEAGLVVSTPGVGTVVRASEPTHRFMQGLGTLPELVQLDESNRIVLIDRQMIESGRSDPSELGRGREWINATILRYRVGETLPICLIEAYVGPEYDGAIDHAINAQIALHLAIEHAYDTQVVEVRQRIEAVSLNQPIARRLSASPRSAGLRISRAYCDARDRVLVFSVGIYPRDRYFYDTVFRVRQDRAMTSN